MSGMNWNRVRWESRIRRFGQERNVVLPNKTTAPSKRSAVSYTQRRELGSLLSRPL